MPRIKYKTVEETVTDSVIISKNSDKKFITGTDDDSESLSIEISSTSTADNS